MQPKALPLYYLAGDLRYDSPLNASPFASWENFLEETALSNGNALILFSPRTESPLLMQSRRNEQGHSRGVPPPSLPPRAGGSGTRGASGAGSRAPGPLQPRPAAGAQGVRESAPAGSTHLIAHPTLVLQGGDEQAGGPPGPGSPRRRPRGASGRRLAEAQQRADALAPAPQPQGWQAPTDHLHFAVQPHLPRGGPRRLGPVLNRRVPGGAPRAAESRQRAGCPRTCLSGCRAGVTLSAQELREPSLRAQPSLRQRRQPEDPAGAPGNRRRAGRGLPRISGAGARPGARGRRLTRC